MEIVLEIKKIIGEFPAYPYHPLITATEIMMAFPDLATAEAATPRGWPRALEESKVGGAGDMVYAGLRTLQRSREGVSIDDLIAHASRAWNDCRAGGHENSIEPGNAQALRLEPKFRELCATWLRR